MIDLHAQNTGEVKTPLPSWTPGELNGGMEELAVPGMLPEAIAQTNDNGTTYDTATTMRDFKIRPARITDVDAMVEVDFASFKSVYESYDKSEAEQKADLHDRFLDRFSKLGGKWMPVLERDGEIVGFITGCPTSKNPEEFESWEAATDNGTLEGLYDSSGKNLYVVTLSVLPEGTKAKDMLMAYLIGRYLRKGIEVSFFESRLPGLRQWVLENKSDSSEESLEQLSGEQKNIYAEEYFGLKKEVDGKQVRQDKLIRLYERVGCQCLKVMPNAYRDEPSMNYGVLCTYNGSSLFDGSELPVKLPENRMTRWAFGVIMQTLARSPKLAGRLLG